MNYFDIDIEINNILKNKHLLQKHLEEKDENLEKLDEALLNLLNYLKEQKSSKKFRQEIKKLLY